MRLIILIFVVISLGACESLETKDIKTIARSAIENGNTARAISFLQPKAEEGNMIAQYELSQVYIRGYLGKNINMQEGMKWLQKAAENGSQQAQNELGYLYATVYKNNSDALKWYKKAAEKLDNTFGIASAENIARMYYYGDGVEQNFTESASWFRKAADHGSKVSQFALGIMFFDGKGVIKNFKESIRLLGLAAKQGHLSARYALIFIYAEGFETKQNIAEAAFWTGSRLLNPTGVSDEVQTAYLVGKFYDQGFAVGKDEMPVMSWLLKSRGVEDDIASQYLHQIYINQWNDLDRAIKFYRTGADAGFVGSQVNLSVIYANHNTPYWNCAESYKWNKLAADKADETAMMNMGIFYSRGPDRVVYQIGVELQQNDKNLKIKDVNSGSPAELAGLRIGDDIVTVNNLDTTQLWLFDFINRIKYSKGKQISLGIMRDGSHNLRPIVVIPKESTIESGTNAVVYQIGIELQQNNRTLKVKNVKSGSPAELAGLKIGDDIATIDIVDITQLRLLDFLSRIRDSKGKKVSLGILRNGSDKVSLIDVIPKESTIKCPGAEEMGFKSNPEQAFIWFSRAAEKGNLEGLFFVANAYRVGNGVAQNYKKAMELYEQGAERGDWEAAQAVSHMYWNGQGVEKSKALGDKWMRKAIQLKHKSRSYTWDKIY